MIATRTNAFSITPDVYDDAVSLLAVVLQDEAFVKPGPRDVCFAPVMVTFTAGRLRGVSYTIGHVALADRRARNGEPAYFLPHDRFSGKRLASVYVPGLARDRALEHVRSFVAFLDTFAAEPAAAGA